MVKIQVGFGLFTVPTALCMRVIEMHILKRKLSYSNKKADKEEDKRIDSRKVRNSKIFLYLLMKA